jgi:hypothetical protein
MTTKTEHTKHARPLNKNELIDEYKSFIIDRADEMAKGADLAFAIALVGYDNDRNEDNKGGATVNAVAIGSKKEIADAICALMDSFVDSVPESANFFASSAIDKANDTSKKNGEDSMLCVVDIRNKKDIVLLLECAGLKISQMCPVEEGLIIKSVEGKENSSIH